MHKDLNIRIVIVSKLISTQSGVNHRRGWGYQNKREHGEFIRSFVSVIVASTHVYMMCSSFVGYVGQPCSE